MSYTIKTTNGSTIAIVQDATLNTIATSLTLVGRDYAGYGAFLNENFVYLLENFAANTAPAHQITGQLWYDTSVKTLKVYDSGLTAWKPISSSIAQSTAPANGSIGDLWFKTTTYQLYVYTGDITIGDNGWQLIGPPTTTLGSLSGTVVESIEDSSSNQHVSIKFYIENNVVAIMSFDSAYTPKYTLAGFSIINPGVNLVNSSTLAGSQYTGDTSNALYLNGISSGQFLRNDQNASSAYQLTLGGGLVIATDLNIKTDTATNEVRVDNLTNNRDTNFYANVGGNKTRLLKINATSGSVDFANVSISQLGDILSNASLTINGISSFKNDTRFTANLETTQSGTGSIGNVAYPFGNIYSDKFNGNLISSNIYVSTGTITGNLTVNGTLSIASNVVASQNYVTTYVQTSGRNSQGVRTISTSTPSGGNDGDIWYQV
jgi:hypothetical protein